MAKFFMTDEGKSDVTAVPFAMRSAVCSSSHQLLPAAFILLMIQYLESRSAAAIEIAQHLFGSESVSCVFRPAVSCFRVYADRTAGKSTRKADEITKIRNTPITSDIYLPQSRVGVKGERGAKVYLDY